MLWQTESCKMPREIAREFAETYFAEPRKVKGFKGEMTGQGFRGEFGLADGVRTYRLESNQAGLWTVEVVS